MFLLTRSICTQKKNKKKGPKKTVSYSHKSIYVGETEYPFPAGLYLTRLVQLQRRLTMEAVAMAFVGGGAAAGAGAEEAGDAAEMKLLSLLSDPMAMSTRAGYAKELSEAMAMVDAVERAFKLAFKQPTSAHAQVEGFDAVRVICLGDGKEPLGAAALCLSLPPSWRYVSIDPLAPAQMKSNKGQWGERIEVFSGLSQDYALGAAAERGGEAAAAAAAGRELSIVIACHSHAPLAEFWARLPSPKLTVTLACCADYCDLPPSEQRHLLLEFEDFEVYSPKRLVKIFYADDEAAGGAAAVEQFVSKDRESVEHIADGSEPSVEQIRFLLQGEEYDAGSGGGRRYSRSATGRSSSACLIARRRQREPGTQRQGSTAPTRCCQAGVTTRPSMSRRRAS